MRGLVTNVQRFSLHDGPGIRTTVFLKGCPLRCFWCHNPEDLRPEPELQFFPDRCIGCGACLERCPEGAHLLEEGRHRFLRERCRACGRCVETCGAEALELAGRWWTAPELVRLLVRDWEFYRQSNGGITLSGGEPLMQAGFCLSVLQLAREEGLHTAMETSAHGPWEPLAALLPWLDLVIVDLKLLDRDRHLETTGVPNDAILANAACLGESGVPLIVRTPVVPGVNDTPEDIIAIAEFIRGWPRLIYYELMPLHRLAEGKYRSLGREYRASGLEAPDREPLEALAAAARSVGVAGVRIG